MIVTDLNVQSIRFMFGNMFEKEEFVIDKSGCKLLEIINATFLANEDYIFKKPNQDYLIRELEWYLSQSRFVKDFPGGAPEIWKQVASKDGMINSNYGWCVYSPENYNQFESCLDTLKNHRESRQAIMIYTRPSMHIDSNFNEMSDFMCTNTVQYLIRDDILHVIVNMRSNDAIFGYRNDFPWQDYIASKMAIMTECKEYKIYWNVGSLHIYERHFDYVRKTLE